MNNSLWMMRALQLAEKGRGRVEPNPRVGSVVLDSKGRLVSEGYHSYFGGPHAEVEALRKAGKKAKGGTLYVTLEPCSTHGKTLPCTDTLLRSGIKHVMVGITDPNPKHRGRGMRILKKAGIKVSSGILPEAVRAQNPEFFKFMTTGIPYITLKMAQSLDGKISTASGESRWITSPQSRKRVQELRELHEALLVGTSTLRQDKPRLRLRGRKGRQPRRIFIVRDPNQLSSYLKSREAKGDILFYQKKPRFLLGKLRQVQAPFGPEGIKIPFLLKVLAQEGISSLLIEGGGEMAASFLKGGWVNRACFFIAPIFIGGRKAPTSVEGDGARRLAKAIRLTNTSVERIGPDILIQGEVQR